MKIKTLVLLLILFVAACKNIPAVPAPKKASNSEEKTILLDEQFDSLDNWTWFHDYDSEGAVVPPTAEEVLLVENGLELGIIPNPNFETAADSYNNTFGISKVQFSPAENEKVVVEGVLAVTSDIFQGSTGIWIEMADTFSEEGTFSADVGFNAFGLSFTSKESISLVRGVKFIRVKGLTPGCTSKEVLIDVREENRYRIEWSQYGWAGYVNDELVKTCPEENIGIASGEVQIWTDNSYVRKLWDFEARHDIQVPQKTLYRSLQVWTEPIE